MIRGLTGYDSFAFVNASCLDNYSHDPSVVTTPFANVLFDWLPCNIIVFKLLLFLLGLSSLLIILKTGMLVDPKHGWTAALFVFLTPLFIQSYKFENDVFSFPLIFGSYYFFMKAKLTKQVYGNLAIGLILLAIAAGFWNGAGIVLVAVALEFTGLFFVILIPLFFYGKLIFEAIAANPVIRENTPGLGFIILFVLNFGVFLAPLPAMTVFLAIVTALNGKFGILVIPLLAFGLVKAFQDPYFLKFRNYFIGGSIGVALATAVVGFMLFPPTPVMWDSVDTAIEWHNLTGKPIKNLFQFGYMIDYRGYEALNYGFYEPGYLMETDGFIVLTYEELDCPKVNEVEPWVYEC